MALAGLAGPESAGPNKPSNPATYGPISIARVFRGRLTRTECLSLRAEGLDTATTVADMPVDELAKRLGGDEIRAEAMHVLAGDWRQQQLAVRVESR